MLSPKEAKALLDAGRPGKHSDEHGLRLLVRGPGIGYWIYKFRTPEGTFNSRSIGPAASLTLPAARKKLVKLRAMLEDGTTPPPKIRKAQTVRKAVVGVAGVSFADAVSQWLDIAAVKWAPKTQAAAQRALNRLPLASLPLDDIDTDAVRGSLLPIKERQRQDVRLWLARLLDFAAGREWITFGPVGNPAKFEGSRKELWPTFEKSGKHHARVSAADLPALYAGIVDGDVARALRFLILTAARTGDVEGATRSEIHEAGAVVLNSDGDEEMLAGDTWIIPAARMKKKDDGEHRVPLTPQMMAILGNPGKPADLLFGKLPSNAMLNLLQKTHPDRTVHGFRSTFRDWAIKQAVPVDHGATVRDLAELALHHALPGGSEVEKSYARDGLCEQRRPLMEMWAAFVTAN